MLTVSSNHIVLGGGSGGGGGGSGDVVGAASSTDNAIARFDGTTGKLLKGSNVTISDTGKLYVPPGSAITPSYAFASDNTTGMYSISPGRFAISASGTGVADITVASGVKRLAINGLDYSVSGSINSDVLRLTGGGTVNGAHLIDDVNGEYLIQCWKSGVGYNYPIVLAPLGGGVGIGTTPTARFDVNGTSRFRGNATFNGQFIDNVGSSGVDGQVLKKAGGLVLWSNP